MRVLSVVGNRPQFIKSAPLSAALKRAGIDEVLLHTGQHYDRELSQLFFEELELGEPDYRLEAGALPREEMIERMRPGIVAAIEADGSAVLVTATPGRSGLGRHIYQTAERTA